VNLAVWSLVKALSLGEKEIAFKDFRMGQVQRALPDYLAAANNVPGFLFTLAVDKRLPTLFGPLEKSTRNSISQILAENGFGDRKPEVAEKLVRIVHTAAFLVGLLAHHGQKIFGMTDADAICANNQLHKQALELFGRVLQLYARPGYKFSLLSGAQPFADCDFELDLLSLTDVVAGTLAQYLTRPNSVKEGAQRVLQWLAHDGLGLKKMTVCMKLGQSDTIQCATLEMGLETLPENVTIIPIQV
jgi:hypothetical protein